MHIYAFFASCMQTPMIMMIPLRFVPDCWYSKPTRLKELMK